MSPDAARNDSGKESATGCLAEKFGPSTLVARTAFTVFKVPISAVS